MPMPLAFTGGSVGTFRDGNVPGATSVVTNDFDARTLLQLIEREQITDPGPPCRGAGR